ncbi:MAG TPA: glucokinase [Terriglobales bacterium]|nr:glucokinase [Terriglobales bacterium]
MILAGDIGGTHARLAFFHANNGTLRLVTEAAYPSREYPGLEQIVSKFVAKEDEPVDAACFGIAGPVFNGRAQVSNLPWTVETARLAEELKLPLTFLINDLEASAWGIGALDVGDLYTLNTGAVSAVGNQAVIAAGTGLGQAGRFWDGRRHQVFACEGGHTDFGPRNELEIELFCYLAAKFGRVSYERVVSGPGLVNVYHFLRDTGRGDEPDWLKQSLASGDPGAVISKAALEGKSPLCEQTVEIFVSLYGAEAGNLALKMLSSGGVFLTGGIAPKILPKLGGPCFMNSFLDKGRMRPLLEAMPVYVVMNENAGLLGAARCAAARAQAR